MFGFLGYLLLLSIFVGVGGYIMQSKNQSPFLGMAIALVGGLLGFWWSVAALAIMLLWPQAGFDPRVYTSNFRQGRQINDDLEEDIIIVDPVVEKEKVYAEKLICTNCSIPVTHKNSTFCSSCGQPL